ncbi:hypothetical protein GFL69_33710 [Rhizobium leguminosarum bv. viciae]|nr:hypothetical protein [Rhizobium leguminosarum bv. viciae]NKM96043.1 hypothetical protein [Rhizobium leguminosarum bv. viciae]
MDDMRVSWVQNFDAPKLSCAEVRFYCTKVSPIPLDRFRIRNGNKALERVEQVNIGSNEAASIEAAGSPLSQGAEVVRARSVGRVRSSQKRRPPSSQIAAGSRFDRSCSGLASEQPEALFRDSHGTCPAVQMSRQSGSGRPDRSAIMYCAYQSGQFSS